MARMFELALAYIDPSSAGFLTQAIVAVVAAVGLTVKNTWAFWVRIVRSLRGRDRDAHRRTE